MDEEKEILLSDSTMTEKKPVGWKAMPYILGNETLERLATFGLMSNFMVYLVREYHMDQVEAATIINTWSALTNFAPIIGAFISDALVGKFATIVFGSVAEILGMMIMTTTALVPQLRPPPCATVQNIGGCVRYSAFQMGVLLFGLSWLSVGTGGIRPSSVPFSIDQFDVSIEEGRKGSRSFFNWYYTTHTIVQLISQTLVVYVQNDISWAIGFAIPTVLMLFAIVLFFVGTRFYVYAKPEGSIFFCVAQVFVAAYSNRKVQSSSVDDNYYQPLLPRNQQFDKTALTDQFRFLNKAAIVMESDIKHDGRCTDKWRICSVRQIEDVKCVISIIPIFASSIVGFLAMNQQQTFIVSQALKMDLRIPGTNYQIPAGSLSVISLVTIGIWLPFYDTILVRPLEKLTKQEGGITLLQKVGIGNFFSILTMLVSGFIEQKRRDSALYGSKLSIFWLAPQLILMGFSQVFTIIGLTEFFNKQVPVNMRSIGNSLLYLALSAASYLSSLVVSIVHDVSGRGDGGDSWLTDDVDTSKLDHFYFLIAGLSTLNLVFFLFCAHGYRYRNM